LNWIGKLSKNTGSPDRQPETDPELWEEKQKMSKKEKEEYEKLKKDWESDILKPALQRFGLEESPTRFYSPADITDFDFKEKVGFPGQYPFTTSNYPTRIHRGGVKGMDGSAHRAGGYSGYGTAENYRDYHRYMKSLGRSGGPNIAFHLPTQTGYDSDHPMARGEVGKTGVAVDTLLDFETIYEAFTGPNDLDKIASNFTINAPCIVIIAMYISLARKRGIALAKLRGTPQNDILKEFASRGTYIFPPKASMRLTRDVIVYSTEHMPRMHPISICAEHMREGGAMGVTDLAFGLANAIAYIQLGIDAGLDVDRFAPRYTYRGFGGGTLNIFFGLARARAARRIFARIMKERFKAKKPRSWILHGGQQAWFTKDFFTKQRPLNNLTRSVVDAIIAALGGGEPYPTPYDEPFGLGHSLEAQQLAVDVNRILEHEAGLLDVVDPMAGSYYLETLTDKVDREICQIMDKIEAMGGAVAAIEQGLYQKEIARGAYESFKDVETGKRKIVGLNCFTGEHEIEVTANRGVVPMPYDPEKREAAEQKQIATLQQFKKERDNKKVKAALKGVKEAARDEEVNLVLPVLEAVEAYATVGEICDVFRELWGEWKGMGL
jgi:methylmalonyl-CoA mutase N-terminal domain/subunit